MGHSRSSGLSRGGAFRAGAMADYTDDYGATHEVTVVRKLSNAEVQERAFLANPNAQGGYYEVANKFGSKSIVWAGRLQSLKTYSVELQLTPRTGVLSSPYSRTIQVTASNPAIAKQRALERQLRVGSVAYTPSVKSVKQKK